MIYKRCLQVLVGLLAGLLLTEGIFYHFDEGAFPHVNIYIPDDELGVRLEPKAEEYIKLHDNPRFYIRTNEDGFRGEDFPPPQEDEILVVGDSQVFGLGVEEDQTFSALLAEKTGRVVINAGVPTYGPPEYTAIAKELIEKRKPKTLIYTLNFVNDLFEYNTPNRDRHAEWDGWAVRIETAPKTRMGFPGRRWLFQQSHTVYAFRRFLWSRQEEAAVQPSLPSEGNWEDIFSLRDAMQESQTRVLEKGETDKENLARMQTELLETQVAIQKAFSEEMKRTDTSREEKQLFRAAEVRPGDVVDIVSDYYLEEGRSIHATAQMIQDGLRYRKQMIDTLKQQNEQAWDELQKNQTQQRKLNAAKKALLKNWSLQHSIPSVLYGELQHLSSLCKANDVSCVLLLLPIDVQVSSDEWKKYGKEPIDMSSSLSLLDEVAQDARRLQMQTASPLESLRDLQPHGFLNGDIHLDTDGHRVVAEVLHNTLQEVAPPKMPEPGIPDNRTWVPSIDDWKMVNESRVKNSNCRYRIIEEWIKINCSNWGRNGAIRVEIVEGGRGEEMIFVHQEGFSLVVPLVDREALHAVVSWPSKKHVLRVKWEKEPRIGWIPNVFFDEAVVSSTVYPHREIENSICDCYKANFDREQCAQQKKSLRQSGFGRSFGRIRLCHPTCRDLFAGNIDACVQTYPESCSDRLDCVQSRPWALPKCPEGQVHAGGNGTCMALCDEQHPCEDGVCHPWQGTGVCW